MLVLSLHKTDSIAKNKVIFNVYGAHLFLVV